MNDVDGRILALSRRHGGHISRAELFALGLTRGAVAHRRARGFLIEVYRGVYAVGRLPTNPFDRAAGALLAAGPGASLFGRSAASAWGIYPGWKLPFEILVPGQRRGRAGLIIHRTRTPLLPFDLPLLRGVRVTSRARTLLDIAPNQTHVHLVRTVNTQRVEHQLRLTSLHDVLDRFPRHRGHRPLSRVVLGAPDEPFRSDWEFEWPPFAAEHELPDYDMNGFVLGHRVDVKFRREGVIVELDGWQTHGSPDAFEHDRDMSNEILAHTGMPTVRITYKQFHRHPTVQAERLHLILDRRRRELRL